MEALNTLNTKPLVLQSTNGIDLTSRKTEFGVILENLHCSKRVGKSCLFISWLIAQCRIPSIKVHELRYSAVLVPEFLIVVMLHKELLKPYFGKPLQQYNSRTTICEPQRTATMLLEPELNSRCNLQNFGFKLQELQGSISFLQSLI